MRKQLLQNKMLSLYNTRELKSLRLYKKSKEMEEFFQEKDTFGLIVSCAGLHSKERIEIQEQFLEKNIKITKISNKLLRFLCIKDTLGTVNNVLHGSLFLIQETNTTPVSLLNNAHLNTILSYKAFKLRFLLWNQNVYRPKEFMFLKSKRTKPMLNILRVLETRNSNPKI